MTHLIYNKRGKRGLKLRLIAVIRTWVVSVNKT